MITNKINGKRYVGQTLSEDIYERWKCHLKKSSNCLYLKHAFQKYKPENFKFEIIVICFDNDCNKYEKEYIAKFNTLVPNGYNLKQGGNNGGKHHPETKKKISETLKLNYSRLTSDEKKVFFHNNIGKKNPNFGKKMSQEQKDLISKKRKENYASGKYDQVKLQNLKNINKLNESRKRKVDQYTTEDIYIQTFDSMRSAGKAVDCAQTSISIKCKNGKEYKGFLWKFAKISENNIKI